MLRKAKNVYYPLAIRPSSFLGFKAALVSSVAGEGEGSPPKAPPMANTSSKEAEQAEDTAKIGDINKDIVQGADLPPVTQKKILPRKKKLLRA